MDINKHVETMSINKFSFILIEILICCFVLVNCVSALQEKNSQLIQTGTSSDEEPRKKQQQQDVFSRILPMLATPFIMQTTLLPIILIGMKFMLLNSIFIGKLALILWAINLFRSRNDDSAALYSHNVNIKHNSHPGHFYGEKYQRYSQHYENGDENRAIRRKRRNIF